jgi:hypothetical protein
VVIPQHGKANLHLQRAGSQVPKERKRVLAEAHFSQPASPAQLSGVFGSAIFCAKPSDNKNFHHRTQPLHCRLLLPFVTSRGSGLLSHPLRPWPRQLVVFLFPSHTHATTKPQRIILAWFLRNNPSTNVINPIHFDCPHQIPD